MPPRLTPIQQLTMTTILRAPTARITLPVMTKQDVAALAPLEKEMARHLEKMRETPYQGPDLADTLQLMERVQLKLRQRLGSTR